MLFLINEFYIFFIEIRKTAVTNTSLMLNSLENIYALLWIFARNRPSMVKRRSDKTKGIKEMQSKLNTQKLEKLRTDLFILNACIINY